MDKPLIQTETLGYVTTQNYVPYVPLVFDDTITLLEKMNKIIIYLNKMGQLSNDVLSQWNTVMEWVMSDGLNLSVVAKLNEMVADGTMDTIINQNIFTDLNTQIADVIQKLSTRTPFTFVELFPRLTGETDDTLRIQRAIDDCSSHGGGIVQFGNVVYVISGALTIPKGVTLQGTKKNMYHRGDLQTTLIQFTGNVNITPFQFADRTGLFDVAIEYPNQVMTLTDVKQYAFTLTADEFFTMENVTVWGAWDFARINGKCSIRNINGYPLHIGFSIVNATDVSYLTNIHFNPNAYNGYLGFLDSNFYFGIVNQYQSRMIDIAFSDNLIMNNLHCYGYTYGIFSSGNGFSSKGEFLADNICFDAVSVGVFVNGNLQNFGMSLNNATIVPIRGNTLNRQGAVVLGGYATGCNIQLNNMTVFGKGYQYAIYGEVIDGYTPYENNIQGKNLFVRQYSKGVINLSNLLSTLVDLEGVCISYTGNDTEKEYRMGHRFHITDKGSNYFLTGNGKANDGTVIYHLVYGSVEDLPQPTGSGRLDLTVFNKKTFEKVFYQGYDTNSEQLALAQKIDEYMLQSNYVIFLTGKSYLWWTDDNAKVISRKYGMWKLEGANIPFVSNQYDSYCAVLDSDTKICDESRLSNTAAALAQVNGDFSNPSRY